MKAVVGVSYPQLRVHPQSRLRPWRCVGCTSRFESVFDSFVAAVAASRTPAMALRAGGLAVGVGVAWFALQGAAAALLDPVAPVGRGLLAPVIGALAVAGFAALLVLNARRRASAPGPFLQALQVHLRQGLYVNAALNRLVAPKGAP